MAYTITELLILETITCYKCGVVFAVPQEMKASLLRDGTLFYCPSGHGQNYTDSTKEQLEREREKNAVLNRRSIELAGKLEQAQTEAVNEQRKFKRLKTRVKNGVCPCCNRTFPDLAAHMKSNHKEYVGK